MPIGSQLKEGTYVGGTPSGTHTRKQHTSPTHTETDMHTSTQRQTAGKQPRTI